MGNSHISGHAGILSSGANNYLSDNGAMGNDLGIKLTGDGSMAIRNFAIWNRTTNYFITGTHTVGEITGTANHEYEHANFNLR